VKKEVESLNIVILLNTAEINQHDFDFDRPQKEGNDNAIAIEDMEAWCLTLFENKNLLTVWILKKGIYLCKKGK
jgi:hypothetical protein